MIQLGTRWPFGSEPPARLDGDVVALLRAVESDLAGDRPITGMWTLTWLEGRPVATLEQDGSDGEVVVTVDAHGVPVTRHSDDDPDDEAW